MLLAVLTGVIHTNVDKILDLLHGKIHKSKKTVVEDPAIGKAVHVVQFVHVLVEVQVPQLVLVYTDVPVKQLVSGFEKINVTEETSDQTSESHQRSSASVQRPRQKAL